MSPVEKQAELGRLRDDRLRVERQAAQMIALRPEHTESYQRQLNTALWEVDEKIKSLEARG